jgi:hypothetical protein
MLSKLTVIIIDWQYEETARQAEQKYNDYYFG